eukprot:gb/GFBE01025229.1/.p1 GENE.gb/GFBE01025229.1/~~gb/GFBE01025229.1/.p1  ORF type:complete len:420 (+),score=65.55 gb/GFBE01025229.1/:1-1260(+)
MTVATGDQGMPTQDHKGKSTRSTGRRSARQQALVSAGEPAKPGEVAAGSSAKVPFAAAAPSAPGLIDPDQASTEALTSQQENAVTARLLKTKMCYFFERGKCASSTCRYAHSPDELRKQPNLQKTKLCKAHAEGACTDGDRCVFAHGEVQLRVTDGIYKTQMCHFFERGRCLKGERCNHAHGPDDMRQPPPKTEEPSAGGSSGSTAWPDTPKVATPGPQNSSRSGLSPLRLGDLLGDASTAPWQPPPIQAAASAAAQASLAAAHAAMLGSSPDMALAAATWGMHPPWSTSGYSSLASPVPQLCFAPTPGSNHFDLSPPPESDQPPAVADETDAEFAEVVPCDLTKRLESLDAVYRGFSADVRHLTKGAAGSHAGAATSEAAASQAATTSAAPAATAASALSHSSATSPTEEGPRRVHRI